MTFVAGYQPIQVLIVTFGANVGGTPILLPDDWKWGKNGVGTVWQNEYSESTTIKWSTMEAAGAVCLPAAGCRFGNAFEAHIYDVGIGGHYWSSTSSGNDYAYLLNFDSGNVNLTNGTDRYYACAVRLVTDVQ